MKVKELIRELKKIDGDSEVLIHSYDSEFNVDLYYSIYSCDDDTLKYEPKYDLYFEPKNDSFDDFETVEVCVLNYTSNED